jgi:hypothetical protein
MAAAVPIEEAHRSEKRRCIVTEALEPASMQLGRKQMLLYVSRASPIQLFQRLIIGGDADE